MEQILKKIHADYAYRRKIYGQNVGVAILDSGIARHPDFYGRIRGFRDFVKGRELPYDDNGHGTHVTGIIGANNHTGLHGVAPECSLFSYKVLDHRGNGRIESTCQAMEHLMKWNKKHPGTIRIVNISVGMTEKASPMLQQKLLFTVERVWDSGVIVLAAAGNNGPGPNTVTSPGTSKKIITVGSLEDVKAGVWKESGYSGRGPTDECVVKPEILMPGADIVSCSNRRDGYARKSGTSMAVPVLTGLVALLLSAYPSLTPNEVKMRLFYSADRTGIAKDRKCWGTVTADRLL